MRLGQKLNGGGEIFLSPFSDMKYTPPNGGLGVPSPYFNSGAAFAVPVWLFRPNCKVWESDFLGMSRIASQ